MSTNNAPVFCQAWRSDKKVICGQSDQKLHLVSTKNHHFGCPDCMNNSRFYPCFYCRDCGTGFDDGYLIGIFDGYYQCNAYRVNTQQILSCDDIGYVPLDVTSWTHDWKSISEEAPFKLKNDTKGRGFVCTKCFEKYCDNNRMSRFAPRSYL